MATIRKIKLILWAILNLPRYVFVAETNYSIPCWNWRVAVLCRTETTKIKEGRLWYEPKEHDNFIELLEGKSTFFDIGSNIGYYSFLSAHYGIKNIIAVEIMKGHCRFLEKWAKRNNLSITVLNKSIGVGESTTFRDSLEKGTAEVISIDELSEKYGYPDVMKIDIEGYEYIALLDAKKTLSKKPNVDISIHTKYLLKMGNPTNIVESFFKEYTEKRIGDTHFLRV